MSSRINRLQGEEGSARTSQFRYGRQNAVTSLMKKAGAVGLSGALIFSCTPAYAVEDDSASSVDNVIGVSSTDEIANGSDSNHEVGENQEEGNSPKGSSDGSSGDSEQSESNSLFVEESEGGASAALSNADEPTLINEQNSVEEYSGSSNTTNYVLKCDSSSNDYSLTLSPKRGTTVSSKSETPEWVSAVSEHVPSGKTVRVVITNGATKATLIKSVNDKAFNNWPSGVKVDLVLESTNTTTFNPRGGADGNAANSFIDSIVSLSGSSSLIVNDGNYLLSTTTGTNKWIVKSTIVSGDITLPDDVTVVGDRAFSGSQYGTLKIAGKYTQVKRTSFTALADDDASPIFDAFEVSSENEYHFVKNGNLVDADGNVILESTQNDSTHIDQLTGAEYSSDWSTLIKVPEDFSGAFTVDSRCTKIDVSAFQGCSGLTSVSGAAVKEVASRAFMNCSQLVKADFPLLENVRSEAFRGAAALAEIDLSKCSSIGDYAFYDCSMLERADLSNAADVGKGAFSMGSESLYGKGLKSVTFSKDLSTIGVGVFSHAALANVDLSNTSLTEIPERAFMGCSSLETVTWPSSLVKIDKKAFDGCSSLSNLDLSGTKASLAYQSFGNCSSLKTVKLSDGIAFDADAQSVCAAIFVNCTSLESVDLSDYSGITHLPDNIFQGCTSLKSVTLPDSVVSLGLSSFEGCSSLESFEVPANVSSIGYKCFKDCKKLSSFTMPSTVRSIGAAALSGTALTEFIAPASLWLNEDGTSRVLNSFNKDSADVANSAAMFTITAAETMGKDEWETEWSSISKVDLSSYSVWFIPAYMFMGLNQMTDVTIPKSVRAIDSGAFFGCMSLKKVFCNNANVDIAGASTYGDPDLGWSVDTPPAFAAWQKSAEGSYELSDLSGIKFYGLAYGTNNLVSYCEKNDCTFVPFVVLGNYDTNDKFGFQISGYNNLKIADMVYTGQALSPEIRVSFTDRDGIADRILTDQDADIVYKDAGGNTLRTIVAPGTYTAEITGHEDEGVYGTQTVTFRVVDPNQQSGGQQSGSQQPAGQQPMQQVNQQTAMPQTGDNAASAAVPATTAAIGALGALSIALAALRRKFGKDSE